MTPFEWVVIVELSIIVGLLFGGLLGGGFSR